MARKSLRDLLVEELREMMDAEKQGARALPQFVKAAAAPSLKDFLARHQEEAKAASDRLNRVFQFLDLVARARSSAAMRGLIEDTIEMLNRDLTPTLRDAALVAAIQKITHFKLASYGSARAHADALGLDPAVKLLEATLEVEKTADGRLNDLALNEINPKAAEPEEEEIVMNERGAAADKPRPRRKR